MILQRQNIILNGNNGYSGIEQDAFIHVEKKIKQIFKGMPEEQIREFAIYGTPEDILKQIELLEQVDIQYLIVDHLEN